MDVVKAVAETLETVAGRLDVDSMSPFCAVVACSGSCAIKLSRHVAQAGLEVIVDAVNEEYGHEPAGKVYTLHCGGPGLIGRCGLSLLEKST